jgi:glutamyl-tRNA synthetase
MIRGRFAPTPSGKMHIGNLCTAMLAWLQTRACGGRFVLRIEDIDKPRSRKEFEHEIIEDLRWFGIDWDEGPDVGGPYGPYRQSERAQLYEEAIDCLISAGRLYPCFCSRADLLAMASAPHGLASEGPVYPGTCRKLSQSERERRAKAKQPSLRFALPKEPIQYIDEVAGLQSFLTAESAGGDFVVRRADGIIGYQLAVVVDDAAMGITDVLRGWDLLDSTPRQLMLYEALGLPAPRFAHVPLLYGPDGTRLSKRHGSLAISAIRASGIQPEQLAGRLAARLGIIDRAEPLRPDELIREFAMNTLPTEPIRLTRQDIAALSGYE